MAIKDRGMDETFLADLDELDQLYAGDSELSLGQLSDVIEWLLKDVHKSDVGVVHRIIRNKLGRP